MRLPIVQFVDDVRALINGGNLHHFNILNQFSKYIGLFLNQKQELPVVALFVNGLGQNEQSLIDASY